MYDLQTVMVVHNTVILTIESFAYKYTVDNKTIILDAKQTMFRQGLNHKLQQCHEEFHTGNKSNDTEGYIMLSTKYPLTNKAKLICLHLLR